MPYKNSEDVPYSADYAIWAFNLCAEAIRTMPKAKTAEPTGRRAAIKAQKARKNAQT